MSMPSHIFVPMPSRLDPEIQHLVGLVNTGQLDTNLSAAQAIDQVDQVPILCD